ncbi:unnamed protein product, partial [Ascophyllum nodosum]
DKEAERLYVAELAGYTNNCMARKAARQKTEAAAAEARKQAQVVVEAKAKAAARQQALMEATTAAPRQRAEAME